MGLTYWLLPCLTGKVLRFRAFAEVQPYLWFVGMGFFSISNHVSGLEGMPRRVYEASYQGAPAAHCWASYTVISAAFGVVLCVSAMSFVLVVGTLLWGRPLRDPPEVEFAAALEEDEPRPSIWDRFGLWTALAAVLIIVAYAVPIAHHLALHRHGSPGFKPY
jgi:cytochrome c oxidase subunit 1